MGHTYALGSLASALLHADPEPAAALRLRLVRRLYRERHDRAADGRLALGIDHRGARAAQGHAHAGVRADRDADHQHLWWRAGRPARGQQHDRCDLAWTGDPVLDIDVELPGDGEDGMSGRNSSESPEPLAGRLGAPAQRRHRV